MSFNVHYIDYADRIGPYMVEGRFGFVLEDKWLYGVRPGAVAVAPDSDTVKELTAIFTDILALGVSFIDECERFFYQCDSETEADFIAAGGNLDALWIGVTLL